MATVTAPPPALTSRFRTLADEWRTATRFLALGGIVAVGRKS